MILSDIDLRSYIDAGRLVIEPFTEEIIRENGLDLRIGNDMLRLLPENLQVYDSRKKPTNGFYRREAIDSEFIIRPNERVLLTTLETITLPGDLMAFCQIRSTFARMGLSIPPTIVDAQFDGQLTIEVTGGSFPIKLYREDRFLHVVFSKLTTQVLKPYHGKYQHQQGAKAPV